MCFSKLIVMNNSNVPFFVLTFFLPIYLGTINKIQLEAKSKSNLKQKICYTKISGHISCIYDELYEMN